LAETDIDLYACGELEGKCLRKSRLDARNSFINNPRRSLDVKKLITSREVSWLVVVERRRGQPEAYSFWARVVREIRSLRPSIESLVPIAIFRIGMGNLGMFLLKNSARQCREAGNTQSSVLLYGTTVGSVTRHKS